MNKILKTASINALLTAAYIIAVALFMNWGSTMKIGKVNTFLAPIALLMLFVLSASITSFLMIGKPAQLYVDGKKKEALSLLSYTLLIFFVITLISLFLLVSFTR